MKKIYFSLVSALLLMLSTFVAKSQVQTPRNITITANTHGFYEYLPQGYGTGKKFPLILFFHGMGELGNGTTQLSTVLRNGPPKLISNGTFPKTFTVNGSTYSFIVISPQFVDWPTNTDVQSVLDYVVAHYDVDVSRIYLTGLSMGGAPTYEYPGFSSTYANRIAAIVPIAAASYPSLDRIKILAAANMPVWAMQNSGDPKLPVSYTQDYVNKFNACVPKPTPAAKMTIFNANDHGGWATGYDPNYREDGKNVYEWMLQYSRGGATAPVNKAPVAAAGADKSITLPTSSVSITGSGSDADGSIASYAWSKVSGPTQFTFSSTTIASPTVSNLSAGDYVFRLTVKDNAGATGYDDVTVSVKAANMAPTANAGADKSITLPTSSVSITGSGSDADGSIASYAWSKVSGPTQFTFSSTTIASPTVSNLSAGDYVFRLTVKDNTGATGYDDVTVSVKAAAAVANKVPVANAGADKSITLPTSSVSITGSGSDADGSIASYAWSKVSGPAQFTFSSTTVASPTISSLVAGDYVFRLTVKDNAGATGYDDVTVSVKAANVAPTANAGADKTITLPTSSVSITGSGTDTDGSIASYVWSKVSGPAQFTFSSTTVASTAISSLVAGTYVFRLTVKDNAGATGYDDVTVSVKEPAATTTPSVGKTVQVNIFGGVSPYTNTAWNNWNLAGNGITSASSSAFKYSDGTSSSVAATISFSQNISDNGTTYQGGMAPAEVLRFTSYSTVTRTLKLSGLSAGKKYDLEFYASRQKANNATVFTIGATSVTVNTDNNFTSKASFSQVTADGSGNISVTIARTTEYNYLNGFTIKESTSSSARTTQKQNIAATAEPVKPEGLSVYPNPASDIVTAQLNNEEKGTVNIRVADASGRLVKLINSNKDSKLSQVKIPVKELKPGIYFITIQVGNWRQTKQIMKFE